MTSGREKMPPDLNPRYVKEYGSYYLLGPSFLRGQRDILLMTDQVAFAFDLSMGGAVLLKHGSPDVVNRYVQDYRAKLVAKGDDFSQELAEGIRLVVLPPDFDVVEINKVISISGYLGTLLQNVLPEALT